VGSYWDGIQIEEGVAATAYVDGTQRGCEWVSATDDTSRILNANRGFTQASNIPWDQVDWSTNSSTGDGVRAYTYLTPIGTGSIGTTNWVGWWDPIDTGFGFDTATPVYSGRYCMQYSAPANGARTRSALVFNYHHGVAVQLIGGSAPLPTTVDSWHGTLSFYARTISGDPSIVVALEDAAGTNLVLSQAVALDASGDWRRYIVRYATASNGYIDSVNTMIVFRQSNPAAAATFQVAGVLLDQNPYTAGAPVDEVRDSDYMPGWPVEHEVWYTTIVDPGEKRGSQFEYYGGISALSARIAGASIGSDDVYLGLPSFSGVVDNSTINLSTLNRCMLHSIAGRAWRDISFDSELHRGVDPQQTGLYGTQAITLWGDAFQSTSTGLGVHDIGSTGLYETYLRVVLGGTFSLLNGGTHAAASDTDSGTEFAAFSDGVTQFTANAGFGAGYRNQLSLSNGATVPLMAQLALANAATEYHTDTAQGDVVLRGSKTDNSQRVLLVAGPTAGLSLQVAATTVQVVGSATNALAVNSDGGGNGANFQLWDTATSSAKFIRNANSQLEIINSAYSAVIVAFTDAAGGGARSATASVATQETTTSTTYTDLATTGPDVTITAPPSGLITVIWGAQLFNSGAAGYASMCPEVFDVTSSSTVSAASDTYGMFFVSGAANELHQSSHHSVFSVTAGHSIRVRAKYRVSGGTGTFLRRRVTVIPSL
jgi:hypothetical protein